MPIYEFVCNSCGHEYERLVGAAAAKVSCPSCRSARVTKKFSVFGSKSGGKFTPSQGGGGCASCHKSTCSSCK